MSEKQIAILKKNQQYICATLVGNTLDSLIVEDCEAKAPKVGDIYIGKVANIVPNIQAAFVEIQNGISCFFPLSEEQLRKKTIKVGMEFPVYIKKSAIKSKQPVVSDNLEFSGKYLVLTTENKSQSISKKITNPEERNRLFQFMEQLTEDKYGIILRTNCIGISSEIIKKEYQELREEAEHCLEIAPYRTCFSCIKTSKPEFLNYIEGINLAEYQRIITDEESIYDSIKNIWESAPLEYYEDTSYSLDHLLSIGVQIEKALHKHVWLKSGGSLVIEPTEALTVIDVNTEKAISGKRNKETTFVKINMEAAKEAARQIRIRNISGIILIDFIDMENPENTEKVLQFLKDEVSRDSIRTSVIDVTKLGLVELTRMKKRRPIWDTYNR